MTSLHQQRYIGQVSQTAVWVACPISARCSQVTVLHLWNTSNMSCLSPSHVNSQHHLFSRLDPSLLPSFLPPWVSPDTGRQDSFWTHQPNSPGARAREAGVPLNTRQDWQSDRKRARPKQPVLPHCHQKTEICTLIWTYTNTLKKRSGFMNINLHKISQMEETKNRRCYRVSGLVLSTATFTPAALWVLKAHTFIYCLSANSVLAMQQTHTCIHSSLVKAYFKHTSIRQAHLPVFQILLLYVTLTHPVTLVTADEQWNFVSDKVSTCNTTVTSGNQQHSSLHHCSNVWVTTPHSISTLEKRRKRKESSAVSARAHITAARGHFIPAVGRLTSTTICCQLLFLQVKQLMTFVNWHAVLLPPQRHNCTLVLVFTTVLMIYQL